MVANRDTENLIKLAQGNQQVFSDLFFSYYPKVKNFVTSIVKSDSVAEDIAQDIFLRLWVGRTNLIEVTSINGYIYRAARNAAYDYLKHKFIIERYAQDVDPNSTISNITEETFQAKEVELLIEIVVSQMPQKRRAVFEMSRREGLKNDEIAGKLGISKKTVENHLSKAISDIKEVLVLFFALISM